jgi:hypothetical protein
VDEISTYVTRSEDAPGDINLLQCRGEEGNHLDFVLTGNKVKVKKLIFFLVVLVSLALSYGNDW